MLQGKALTKFFLLSHSSPQCKRLLKIPALQSERVYFTVMHVSNHIKWHVCARASNECGTNRRRNFLRGYWSPSTYRKATFWVCIHLFHPHETKEIASLAISEAANSFSLAAMHSCGHWGEGEEATKQFRRDAERGRGRGRGGELRQQEINKQLCSLVAPTASFLPHFH